MRIQIYFAIVFSGVGCCSIPTLTKEEYARLAAAFEVAPIKNVGFGAKLADGWMLFRVDSEARFPVEQLESLRDDISERMAGFHDGFKETSEDPGESYIGESREVPGSSKAQGFQAGARLARMQEYDNRVVHE